MKASKVSLFIEVIKLQKRLLWVLKNNDDLLDVKLFIICSPCTFSYIHISFSSLSTLFPFFISFTVYLLILASADCSMLGVNSSRCSIRNFPMLLSSYLP